MWRWLADRLLRWEVWVLFDRTAEAGYLGTFTRHRSANTVASRMSYHAIMQRSQLHYQVRRRTPKG